MEENTSLGKGQGNSAEEPREETQPPLPGREPVSGETEEQGLAHQAKVAEVTGGVKGSGDVLTQGNPPFPDTENPEAFVTGADNGEKAEVAVQGGAGGHGSEAQVAGSTLAPATAREPETEVTATPSDIAGEGHGNGESGLTPPTATTGSEGTAQQTIEKRINETNDANSKPIKYRADRLQQYNVARGKIKEIESKLEDQRTDQEKSDLVEARKTTSRIKRDADFEIKREAAQQGNEDGTAEAVQEIDEAQVEAWKSDSLEDNPDYQNAKGEFESDENKRWKDIDGIELQGDQDTAISKLSVKDKKAYEQYVETRERLKATEDEAGFAAQERLIAQKEQEGKASEQTQIAKRNLELDRRKKAADSMLAVNHKYQGMKRKYRALEDALKTFYSNHSKSYSGSVQEMIHGMAGEKWEHLSEEVRQALVKAYKGDETEASRMFKEYSFDKGIMNGIEQEVEETVNLNRLRQRVDEGGNPIPADQIPARIQEYWKSRTDKRQGPNFIRKGINWTAKKIDAWFGKEAIDINRKAAYSYAIGLLKNFGWKGMIAQWALSEEDRKIAKTLRSSMFTELRKYAFGSARRKVLQLILLSILFWVVLPVVIGKGLDIVKPFGGGNS